MALKMKYFVLKPRSKTTDDPFARASRAAMQTYAKMIEDHDRSLAADIRSWVTREASRVYGKAPGSN